MDFTALLKELIMPTMVAIIIFLLNSIRSIHTKDRNMLDSHEVRLGQHDIEIKNIKEKIDD